MNNNLNLLKHFKSNYLDVNNNLKLINIDFTDSDSLQIFEESNWTIETLDISNNSSIVVEDKYIWSELASNSYDVVISINLNKMKFFWLTLAQIERILKPNGYVCIITSNELDDNYYSFSKKALCSLISYVNLNLLEIFSEKSVNCVIASKDSISNALLNNNFEKETFDNKFDSIRVEYENNLNEIKKYNFKLNSSYNQIKSLLMDIKDFDNYYCPICGSFNEGFLPFGNPSRLGAKCPNCGSLERHRLAFLFLKEKTDILIRNSKIFQFNPIISFYNFFSKYDNLEYVAAGNELNNSTDEVIDLENIPYPDDTFDCVLNFHVLDKLTDDIKAMSELYRIVKPFEKGGFVLINAPVLREKTLENNNYEDAKLKEKFYHDTMRFRVYGEDIKERLESVGFIVEKYAPEDFIDSRLFENYGIKKDYLYFCRK